jgi:hypothetical protein
MGFQSGAPAGTRRAVISLAALAGLGFLAGCHGAGAAAAATLSASAVTAMQGTLPPPGLLTDTVNDMLFAGSVQDVLTINSPGGMVSQVTDVTVGSGRQVITMRSSAGGGAITLRVSVLLIGKVSYVYGDATGLNRLIGIPQNEAEQAAGQWIAVRPGEKLGQLDYNILSGGLTLDDLANSVAPTGRLTPTAPAIVAGQPVRGVQGTDPGGSGTARLYVTDTNSPLPVTYAVPGGAAPFQISFRHWGEPLHLTAPPDPIPASSVTPGSALA